jgi:uncharacterized membrane protein
MTDSDVRLSNRRWSIRERGLQLIALASVAYSVLWTVISIMRLVAFRASVYDLGVFAQAGWRVYAANLSPEQFILTYLNLGGTLFLFPLVIAGYNVILTAQSFALGIGGVLVYLIARNHRFSPGVSLTLSSAYLLYFPLAGINFTDAHYEAYLVPLFLAGYWLFLEGRFIWSFTFLALASSIKFPLSAYPLLFGILIAIPILSADLLRALERRSVSRKRPSRATILFSGLLSKLASLQVRRASAPVPSWYGYSVPLFAGAILLGGFLTNGLYYPNNGAASLVHATSVSLLPNFGLKWWTFLLLFGPLAFTPLLSPRWMILCAPFLALVFFVNYAGYTYPTIVTSWYTCLILPFLVIGAIDGIDKLREGKTWADRALRWISAKHWTRHPSFNNEDYANESQLSARFSVAGTLRSGSSALKSPTVVATLVLLLVLITAAFFTPYGPFNSDTEANFYFPSLLQSNETLYDNFMELASLIPPTDPAVIIQDNMPGLLPRPLMPGSLSPLVAGPFDQVAYNLTWPNPNGSWTPINPDYVIGNPTPLLYSFFQASGSYPFNISMQQILNELYGSYDYGILGEADGMLLLEHNYDGPVRYYVPLQESFAPFAFSTPLGSFNGSDCDAPCLSNANLTDGQTSWYGPYAYLSPGTYYVTFDLTLSDWSASDHITLDVSSDSGKVVLGTTNIFGPANGQKSLQEHVVVPAYVANGATQVEFRGVSSSYNGSIQLYGVSVNQISAPPTIFRAGETPEDTAVYNMLNLTPKGSTILAESSLRPYFDQRELVTLQNLSSSPAPNFELYDPAVPSDCSPGLSTLCSVVNASYADRNYGVIGEEDGVTLLERNETSLQSYAPYSDTVSPLSLRISGAQGQNFTSIEDGILVVNNQTNGGWSWYGPYLSLPPGNYSATFQLLTTNNSVQNSIRIDVSSWSGKVELGAQQVTGVLFAKVGLATNITINFETDSFSSSIELRGWQTLWSGALELYGITVLQSSAA